MGAHFPVFLLTQIFVFQFKEHYGTSGEILATSWLSGESSIVNLQVAYFAADDTLVCQSNITGSPNACQAADKGGFYLTLVRHIIVFEVTYYVGCTNR